MDKEVEKQVLEDGLEGVDHAQTRLVLLGHVSCLLEVLHHHTGLPVGVETITQNLPDLLVKEETTEEVVSLQNAHGFVEGGSTVSTKVNP